MKCSFMISLSQNGVILAGGVVNLFVVGQRSFRMDENVARMQDEGRFAINEIVKDVRMAGYIGELVHPVSIVPDPGLASSYDRVRRRCPKPRGAPRGRRIRDIRCSWYHQSYC